jgi:hypothetical protein
MALEYNTSLNDIITHDGSDAQLILGVADNTIIEAIYFLYLLLTYIKR